MGVRIFVKVNSYRVAEIKQTPFYRTCLVARRCSGVKSPTRTLGYLDEKGREVVFWAWRHATSGIALEVVDVQCEKKATLFRIECEKNGRKKGTQLKRLSYTTLFKA